MAQEAQVRGDGSSDDLRVSLVRGDVMFRLQRRIGLIPEGTLGLGRRALLLAGLTWLPVAVWALAYGRALPGEVGEPLMEHFGVQVRCLIAIPLLVLAEGVAHRVTTRLMPYFVDSGLVAEDGVASFRGVVHGILRLRDSSLPWVAIGALVLGWTVFSPVASDAHEVLWAVEPAVHRLRFGGWWFFYVARPVYLALLAGWVWRLLLLVLLLKRIAGLDLRLVPTHPDRAAGLGFLEGIPAAFGMVVLACSAVASSRWAHDVVYHGVHVAGLRMYAAALLVALLVLFTAPLLVFVPTLLRTKRQALLEYGALVGEHGRLVRRRWIARQAVSEDALLGAPEIGPVADTLSLYQAVESMRPAPLGMRSLLPIAIPAALPMLMVAAIEIPVRDVLMKLVKTLV